MINSKLIKLAIVIFSLPISSTALAMTPGSSKAHWKPTSVEQLTPNEVRELNTSKCLITSYRNEEETTTKNSTNKPDEYDQLMLVRGEFATKGQKDLLVLCKSSENGERYLFLVWGGSKQCTNKLLISKTSRFMKEFGQSENYYGARLSADSASNVLYLVDRVFDGYEAMRERVEGVGATVRYWRIDEQKVPQIDHDSMTFSDNYISTFYCDGKSWVQLLDVYTDYTD